MRAALRRAVTKSRFPGHPRPVRSGATRVVTDRVTPACLQTESWLPIPRGRAHLARHRRVPAPPDPSPPRQPHRLTQLSRPGQRGSRSLGLGPLPRAHTSISGGRRVPGSAWFSRRSCPADFGWGVRRERGGSRRRRRAQRSSERQLRTRVWVHSLWARTAVPIDSGGEGDFAWTAGGGASLALERRRAVSSLGMRCSLSQAVWECLCQ